MRVYRFHDRVAVTPPDGPTYYLPSRTAEAVASAIMSAVADIRGSAFGDSTFRAVEIDESRADGTLPLDVRKALTRS